MKLLPFDIEKIKAGAKCVDQHGDEWIYTGVGHDARFPHRFRKSIGAGHTTFTDVGTQFLPDFMDEYDYRLSILDESETEAESPWIRYEDRKPTMADGNEIGLVLIGSSTKKETSFASWGDRKIDCWDFWMPIPPLPKPKRDFQKEWLDKQDERVLFIWNKYMCGKDRTEFKAKWEAENL